MCIRDRVADELIAAAGVDMKYQVGTMIEIPRADVYKRQVGSGLCQLEHLGLLVIVRKGVGAGIVQRDADVADLIQMCIRDRAKGEPVRRDKSECLVDLRVDAFIPEKYRCV